VSTGSNATGNNLIDGRANRTRTTPQEMNGYLKIDRTSARVCGETSIG
jgi:hypothetical protein